MFTAFAKAFKVKSIRNKLLFTLLIILATRLGSQIPVPGVDVSYFRNWFSANSKGALGLLSAFTGGSFERFSIFALGVTPYITASIIIQLLAVVFPSLSELQKDGDYGKKKLEWITRFAGIGLAVFESTAMAIGFARSGLLPGLSIVRGILVVIFFTLGTIITILLGVAVDKKGIGNGISIILLANILSGLPRDYVVLYEMFIKGKPVAPAILAAVLIILFTLLTITLVILLNDAVRVIPVKYPVNAGGRLAGHGVRRSDLPIKVNTAGVIPIIFASSIMSVPQLFASILGKGYGSGISRFILNMLSQNSWFDKTHPEYTIGLALYLALVFFFAYFYTSISFNPIEISNDIKKQGASIPGIRPGKPTTEYLTAIINHLVFIGAVGLIIVTLVPLLTTSILNASLSFGGTSIIIIVGVILEVIEKVESEMKVHYYKGFVFS